MADESTGEGRGIPLWLVAGIFLAWALPGLFGREPWKPDEGYTIGLINHVLTQGDWVVPTLTGEPFMEKPPLFFLTAALFAKLLSPMPMHQAAACATLFYVGFTFLFVYFAGRESAGKEGGAIAALGLMGCIGFVVRAHTAITDTALWCGFAIACYGMLLPSRRHLAGAFWFGTGAGVAFMAKGFVGPAFIGLAAFLLPLFCPDRRGWRYVRRLAWSFVFALPWLVIWPAALFLRSPELFADWFWLNNVGRFAGPGFGLAALARTRWRYFVDFPWFTLPLWPAVLWLWWSGWRKARREAAAVYPTLVAAVGLGMLTVAATQRELYMIPLLIPLAVLAARGNEDMPPWLERTLCLVPLYAGGAALAALWAVWSGWVTGFPAGLVQRLDAFAPGLEPGPGPAGVVLALLYTGAWLWFFVTGYRRYWPFVWAACLTAVWGTAMLLFLNVLDHVNSYRAVLAAVAEHLPDDPSIIDAYNLGESQRALLEYYHGRRTRAVILNGREPESEYLLVQNYYKNPRFHPGADWRVIWEGTRPGDKKEWYVLFHRPRAARAEPWTHADEP